MLVVVEMQPVRATSLDSLLYHKNAMEFATGRFGALLSLAIPPHSATNPIHEHTHPLPTPARPRNF